MLFFPARSGAATTQRYVAWRQALALGSLVIKEESGLRSLLSPLLRPFEHYVPFWRERPQARPRGARTQRWPRHMRLRRPTASPDALRSCSGLWLGRAPTSHMPPPSPPRGRSLCGAAWASAPCAATGRRRAEAATPRRDGAERSEELPYEPDAAPRRRSSPHPAPNPLQLLAEYAQLLRFKPGPSGGRAYPAAVPAQEFIAQACGSSPAARAGGFAPCCAGSLIGPAARVV